jgi:hypothetical protein
MDITDEFQKVGLLLHHYGLVAILEEMALPPMPPIEGSRVASKERSHHPGKRNPARPEQEVRVVGQQCPCIYRQVSVLGQDGQTAHEICPVAVFPEDWTPFNAPHHYMVQGAGCVEPRATGHSVNVTSDPAKEQTLFD